MKRYYLRAIFGYLRTPFLKSHISYEFSINRGHNIGCQFVGRLSTIVVGIIGVQGIRRHKPLSTILSSPSKTGGWLPSPFEEEANLEEKRTSRREAMSLTSLPSSN